MHQQTVIIVAHTARILAQAAAACGLRVHVLESHGDPDPSVQYASWCRLPVDKAGHFIPYALLRAVSARCRETRRQKQWAGLWYGSGFEAQPTLLNTLTKWLPVWGNTARTVARCQNPGLAHSLLCKLAIPHPETLSRTIPGTHRKGHWLIKHQGGTGGLHVHHYTEAEWSRAHTSTAYLQRHVSGRLLSVLLAADGRHFHILGFSEQFSGDTWGGTFVFAGGIRYLPTSALRATIQHWLAKLVPELGLQGLCGIDLVARREGKPLLLEVNPRPPASLALHLHPRQKNAFLWHAQACTGALSTARVVPNTADCLAMRYLFARQEGYVRTTDWPDWLHDTPDPTRRYRSGEALCTVLADGADRAQTLARLRRRLRVARHLMCRHWTIPRYRERSGKKTQYATGNSVQGSRKKHSHCRDSGPLHHRRPQGHRIIRKP